MTEMRTTSKILFGKPKENGALGRPQRWEDNIKIDTKETGCENVDCSHLVQGWWMGSSDDLL
jgi:hypothetical protein